MARDDALDLAAKMLDDCGIDRAAIRRQDLEELIDLLGGHPLSLYLNREGEIILTVIHRKQLSDLRSFIKKTDPEAFVVINDTYDVLGKGFKSHLIT